MNQLFNRRDQTAKRQRLRNDAPPAEILLWAGLRKQTCGAKFRRQVSVGAYVLDFYCPAVKLAIEIDGPTHESDEALAYDAERQRQIESLGVRFLRFSNAQVYGQLPDVLEMIQVEVARLLAERQGVAAEPPLSSGHLPLREGERRPEL